MNAEFVREWPQTRSTRGGAPLSSPPDAPAVWLDPVDLRGYLKLITCLAALASLLLALTPAAQRCLWRLSGRASGDELLFQGIVSSNPTWVTAALQQGASVHARDTVRMTPLMWAADVGDEELVERLLAAGADLTASSDQELTPLAIAAGSGHVAIVERLLHAGASVDQPTALEGTALHWSAGFFQLETVNVLLAHGARTDARDKLGRTPLMLAARDQGGMAVVRRLLSAGADPRAADDEGLTAIDLAAPGGNNGELVNLLEREIRNWTEERNPKRRL